MKIIIETIPHASQRYPTVGDWYRETDGTLHIKVSALSDWRMEALVAVHELVEVLACEHAGITQEQVDNFDTNFEKVRAKQLEADLPEAQKTLIAIAEPGDDFAAPYRAQHCLASGIERILAPALGLTWAAYECEIEALA